MDSILYTIRDCEGCVRYVGATSRPMEMRMSGHYSDKSPVGNWLREERDAGRPVEVVIEEEGSGFLLEPQYIRGYAKLVGSKLFNQRHREDLRWQANAFAIRRYAVNNPYRQIANEVSGK